MQHTTILKKAIRGDHNLCLMQVTNYTDKCIKENTYYVVEYLSGNKWDFPTYQKHTGKISFDKNVPRYVESFCLSYFKNVNLY